MASQATYYRNRLKKKNPEKYAEYLHRQCEAAKQRRYRQHEDLSKTKPSKKSLALKERQREQGRIRQKAYMERKKRAHGKEKRAKVKLPFITPKRHPARATAPVPTPAPINMGTRAAMEAKRAYWRERKQAERQRLKESRPQKLRRIREKDRQRKRDQRAKNISKKQNPLANKATTPGYQSVHTLRNHTSKARKVLPNTPEKFASVVCGLVRNSSPRKKMALKQLGLTESVVFSPKFQQIAEKMKEQKGGKDALKRFAQASVKFATKVQISKQLKLSRGTISRAMRSGGRRTTGRGKMAMKLRQQITEFYLRQDISRPLPSKRYATKHGAGHHLQMTMRAAHSMFVSENPTVKVSYAKFTYLRPKNVRLLSKVHHEVCVCVYCVNIKYKLLVVNRAIDTTRKAGTVKKIADEFDFINHLLCPISDSQRFHKEECVFGTCDRCGNYGGRIREMYQDIIRESNAAHTWLHWEKEEVRDGKVRRVLKTKQGSMEMLINEMAMDVEKPVQGVSFVKHLFTARWQHRQFASLKENLPANWGIMIMDFGQNRKVFYQDEIKSAYFGQRQITMHPIVMYYKRDNVLFRDSQIYLSDDITHDYHAVEHFLTLASDHLARQIKVEREIIWSDGCQSQYKGKGTFADLSLSSETRERNYYGSEHGKGEGDGEIGVVNRAVDRAILGRKLVINSAKDMWEWCCENVASDEPFSKRTFVYVAKNEIERQRPQTEVTTLKGSRGYHQFHVVGPYKLKVRRLSCFCSSCLIGNEPMCNNSSYTGNFQHKNLHLQGEKKVQKNQASK